MDPHGGDFCEIYATEHLLSKKPNAIVILVNGKLRPKFNYIEHDYFNPHAARLTNEAREKLRNVSDEEVVKEYYVSGSEDDF